MGGWGRRQNLLDLNSAYFEPCGSRHELLRNSTLFTLRVSRMRERIQRHPELTLCLRQGVFSYENTRQFQLRWSCLLHMSGGGSRTGGEKSQQQSPRRSPRVLVLIFKHIGKYFNNRWRNVELFTFFVYNVIVVKKIF